MPEKWDVYVLGKDNIVATFDSYFDAMDKAKTLSKTLGYTHCVTLHGVGST